MLEKIKKFMIGRYGLDDLGKFLIIFAAILTALSMLTSSRVIYVLSLIFLILYVYRMLSKNHQKRYKENSIYLQCKNKSYSSFNNSMQNMQQKKTYHIFKCPSCKQRVRIPKGKGKVTIICPKCKTEFNKKS